MAGFNINKYQWEALYQANPVIWDPKLSHPVEREDGHGDHPRTPDATQGWHFDRPGEAGDHQAATETSSPLHLEDVYDATGFTCYIHNIALFDIHLRVDLSNSA